MRRYSENLIKQVKRIRRKEKLSFRQLSRRFGIPGNTIRKWCDDLVGTRWDAILIDNEKKRAEIKRSEIHVAPDIDSITKDQARFLAGILYGCEGSKYPSHSGVAFANSEPNLVLGFLQLLRRAFDLNDSKFSVHLQAHVTQDYEEIKKFWSNLLSLPQSCFIKPTVRQPAGKKHRNNYLGTCTLRYRDYRIQLKLLGIFEKFIETLASNEELA